MARAAVLVALTVLITLSEAAYVRKDMRSLTPTQRNRARTALNSMKSDNSITGFLEVTAAHGHPPRCNGLFCCYHMQPLFIYWHRCYAMYMEDALNHHGYSNGLFYFDWGANFTALPRLLREQPATNPWYDSDLIDMDGFSVTTARDIDPALYQLTPSGYTDLFERILLAFEFTNFCDFAFQLEMAHNYLHGMIGGSEWISMSLVPYAAWDPIFHPSHAYVDKVVAIYQEAQVIRGISGGLNNCLIDFFNDPLEPFTNASLPFQRLKNYCYPSKLLTMSKLNYKYDNMELNGLSAQGILNLIANRQHQERCIAKFNLTRGPETVYYVVKVCTDGLKSCEYAGNITVFGNYNTRPGGPGRTYYHDVTYAVNRGGYKPGNLQAQAQGYYYRNPVIPVGSLMSLSVLTAEAKPPTIYAPVETYNGPVST